MYSLGMESKRGVVFGVANEFSIAWAIARTLHEAGSSLVVTYQNERLGERVSKLTGSMDRISLLECDVSSDESLDSAFEQIKTELGGLDFVIHSIAYANREDLKGGFSKIARDSFLMSLDISAYSLIAVTRYSAPLMNENGSVVLSLIHI